MLWFPHRSTRCRKPCRPLPSPARSAAATRASQRSKRWDRQRVGLDPILVERGADMVDVSVTDRPQRSKRHTSTTSISRRRAVSSNFSRSCRCAAPLPTYAVRDMADLPGGATELLVTTVARKPPFPDAVKT